MSASRTTATSGGARRRAARTADELDQRLHPAAGLRRQFNKVFPTHWSFLVSEVALYSFIVLVLTGIYLALFYDPSMTEVTYQGEYSLLRGREMTRAYESTLQLSFEVRGGLWIRQTHHWSALLFLAAMMVHMFRTFFTGAFRKPRESNWVLGVLLLLIATFEGFTGYSLADDLLSGTGLRIGSGITLSIPVVGTWLHWALFGGEFPGMVIIPRLYIVHVLLLPGILLALIGAHLGLVWYQKHTQFPGPGRTEHNVVGVRILPGFAAKTGGLFAATVGVTAIMGGVFQINPVWNYGPYSPGKVSAGSQPDFYIAFTDGALRLMPPWAIDLGDNRIPPTFWAAAVFIAVIFGVLLAYPYIERRFTRDNAIHNLLQRPRDAPVRTSLGVMAVVFYFWLLLASATDIFAYFFSLSLNAVVWAGRIGLFLLPPLAYWVTYRICLGLQRGDRQVLEHGIETGVIKRLPTGEFIEIHQPLAGNDPDGHPVPLAYQGAPVPKRMNQLGAAGRPPPGSLVSPDPPEEVAASRDHRADGDGARGDGARGDGQMPRQRDRKHAHHDTYSEERR